MGIKKSYSEKASDQQVFRPGQDQSLTALYHKHAERTLTRLGLPVRLRNMDAQIRWAPFKPF